MPITLWSVEVIHFRNPDGPCSGSCGGSSATSDGRSARRVMTRPDWEGLLGSLSQALNWVLVDDRTLKSISEW